MALLGSRLTLAGVWRDQVGYKAIDGVGNAIGSHGCIVARRGGLKRSGREDLVERRTTMFVCTERDARTARGLESRARRDLGKASSGSLRRQPAARGALCQSRDTADGCGKVVGTSPAVPDSRIDSVPYTAGKRPP